MKNKHLLFLNRKISNMERVFSFFISFLFLVNSSLFAWHHIFHKHLENKVDLAYKITKDFKKEIDTCKLCLNIFLKIPENKSIIFLNIFYFFYQDLKIGFFFEDILNKTSRGPPLKI